jgi:nitric oxide reductase activation protein
MRDRTAKIAIEQEKARNDDRQKRLVADTQKLLALATELKADVDRTNKDTLSVDVVKKADEIEKLAHSVKEKMKGS